MQIWDVKSLETTDSSCFVNSDWATIPFASSGNFYAEILNVEVVVVESGRKGLQVLRIGTDSPLRRLRPLGSFNMQGMVESGDRIVAIDGVAISTVGELERLVAANRSSEITIFDHRTRLTVSWQIHVREMLEAA